MISISIYKPILSALVALTVTGAVAFGQPTKALATFSKTAGLRKAQWGFVCQEIGSGKMVASREANLSLMPASTMKTLTTGAALAVLGPDYRVTTRLCYDGTLSADGVLEVRDVLERINGREITSPDMLVRTIQETEPGDVVTLRLERDRQQRTVTVTPRKDDDASEEA